MIVGVLTTCHTQHTWDRSTCVFLFNRTTLQVFVTYLTGALYVHPLWFYKHQHDNRVRSKLFVACLRWLFQWRFLFVPAVPGCLREEEEHKPDPWHRKKSHGVGSGERGGKLLKPRQSFWITLYYWISVINFPLISLNICILRWGRGSSVGIPTRYGLDSPEIESRWLRNFPHRHWGPPSLL